MGVFAFLLGHFSNHKPLISEQCGDYSSDFFMSLYSILFGVFRQTIAEIAV